MVDVSIIMPVYNGSRYLQEALESVLNQTYYNFEFIIINDGSIDDTAKILEKYKRKDPRIKIITNTKNIGIAKSLNIGIKISSGKYIARIDSDDIWDSSKLEIQIHYMESYKDIGLLGTSVFPINNNGNIIKKRRIFNNGKMLNTSKIKFLMLFRNPYCHSSIIFKSSLIPKVGLYNEDYLFSQDYEYWFRVVSISDSLILKNKLVYFRIHNNMTSIKANSSQLYYSYKAKNSGILNYYNISYYPFIIYNTFAFLFKIILIYCISLLKKYFKFQYILNKKPIE